MKSCVATSWMGRLAAMAAISAALLAAIAAPVRAADSAVVAADKALVAAFEKADQATINKYLDPDFTWIDFEGVMTTRQDALALGMKPLVGHGSEVKIRENKVGENATWLQVSSGNKYSGRAWVKRASGWKVLHTSEILGRPHEEEVNLRPSFAVPCTNPCQTVPFKPADQVQASLLPQWQEQVGSREQLIRHTGEVQTMVMSYGGETPPRKVRLTGPTPPSSRPPVGSPQVLWMRMWTIDPQTVVMIATHQGYGQKAYWASRIFHLENGLWLMLESYHNTIQASRVMNPVEGR